MRVFPGTRSNDGIVRVTRRQSMCFCNWARTFVSICVSAARVYRDQHSSHRTSAYSQGREISQTTSSIVLCVKKANDSVNASRLWTNAGLSSNEKPLRCRACDSKTVNAFLQLDAKRARALIAECACSDDEGQIGVKVGDVWLQRTADERDGEPVVGARFIGRRSQRGRRRVTVFNWE